MRVESDNSEFDRLQLGSACLFIVRSMNKSIAMLPKQSQTWRFDSKTVEADNARLFQRSKPCLYDFFILPGLHS